MVCAVVSLQRFVLILHADARMHLRMDKSAKAAHCQVLTALQAAFSNWSPMGMWTEGLLTSMAQWSFSLNIFAPFL